MNFFFLLIGIVALVYWSKKLKDFDDKGKKVETRNKFKRYKIQEVIKPNQVILVQVIKDERGQKGAALSTFISIDNRHIVFSLLVK